MNAINKMFSKRLNIDFEPNLLTELYNKKAANKERIIDLTVSNPTKLGFNYDKKLIKRFIDELSLSYNPDPQGLYVMRSQVKKYYQTIGKNVSVDDIFITSSTSESYSFLFKLLLNPDEEILIPQPCYPLFEYLAMLDNVKCSYYKLFYDYKKGWQTNFKILLNLISDKTKAIIIVNPNNPTGSYLNAVEYKKFNEICTKKKIAIIVDEVFSDYLIEDEKNILHSVVNEKSCLSFVLNGISKLLALPQMKLGWIYIQGEEKYKLEAKKRLDIICDTYLSPSIPIQNAAEILFSTRTQIQKQILERIKNNYNLLKGKFLLNPDIRVLKTSGGWNVVISFENMLISEEQFVYNLLNKYNVFVHPGFYYDFWKEGYAVISLLTPTDELEEGISRIIKYYTKR